MQITDMVLQRQQGLREEIHQRASHLRPVTGVSDLASYSTFGRLLKTVRENKPLTQEEVAELLDLYLREQGIPTLNVEIYGNLERGKRYPAYAELLPLYRALVEGCGITFSLDERDLYVIRAREKIAQKRRRIERVTPEQWQQLVEEIVAFDSNYSAPLSIKQDVGFRSEQTDGYKRPIVKIIDTSYILGRNEWIERMLSLLRAQLAKKVVVVQALTGTGKTTAFKLLERRLDETNECRVLPPYVFRPSIDKTPEDHLDSFLADVITLLQMKAPQSETAKTPPLNERIDDFLNAVIAAGAEGKKLILLLDDLQVTLDEKGELPDCWHQFIAKFCEYEHTAVLYAATREWPAWRGEQKYIDESMLERLPPDICVKLWQRLGFADVPEDLLRRASHRCDGNAGEIELRAKSLRRPRLVYDGWRKSGSGSVSARDIAKSENQRIIEQWLEEESVFETRVDIQTREILEQVVSTRLSHHATRLLDVLSVSAFALPFAFLDDICPDADLAFDELLRCSLVDRDSMVIAGRASLLSFVREACLHKLLQEQRVEEIEHQIVEIYEAWLRSQDFSTDQEKSAVVSELTVLYMKRHRFLDAAHLFITYGWLCTLFGQIPRLLRVYESSIQRDDWKTNPEGETGVLLLRYQLAQRSGQKIDTQQHHRSFQKIHDYLVSQLVRLHPATEVHLAHQLMLIPMRAKQFAQAYRVLEDTFERIAQAGTVPAEAHASFLYSKARLLARWGEYEEENKREEGTWRLRNECVEVLAESIASWKECQVNALPLQRRYVDFRLARALNDYAYRQRLRGHFHEAEEAMRECLRVKKEGAALPKSLATSLSEYSQILAALGRIEEAGSYNDQAQQIMHTLKDHAGLDGDRGMILVERGELYLLQARIDDAEICFKEGRDLTRESDSRQKFHKMAVARLEWIEQVRQSKLRYQLDAQWFEQYATLVAYDELDWLLQGGPFTIEEQKEWDTLFDHRQEAPVKARMSELLIRSRQREFARCIEEGREPRLYYPNIPLDEIEARIRGFENLKAEISAKEANTVVRQLYLDTMEEHLSLLRLCASIYAKDLENIRKYNQVLYGLPSVAEMKVALHWLFSLLERARKHTQATSLVEPLVLQLKHWHLHAEDFLDHDSFERESAGENKQSQDIASKQKIHEKKVFSASAVQRFFQDVLHSDYHATDWDIIIEPARESTYINVDVRKLALPQRSFSTEKIRQLLAEEIETHAFRSMAGRRSPLALLASGTARYSGAEEGLAKHYIQQVIARTQGRPKNNSWPGTLAIGLMAGVISPPLTFRTLCAFLEKVFLVKNLVLSGGYESLTAAGEAAKQEAWKRASRTVRGITDLTIPGLCSLKDRVYLQGALDVARYVEKAGDIQQLYVGKIGLGQIEAMTELHIMSPSLPHLYLALDLNLHERIAAFEEN